MFGILLSFFLIICISRSIFFLLQISRLITMYYIWDFHLWTLSLQGLTYHLRLTYAHKAIDLLHIHNVCSKPSTIHRPAHIISSHRPPSLCPGYQIRVRSHQNMCIAQISVWNLNCTCAFTDMQYFCLSIHILDNDRVYILTVIWKIHKSCWILFYFIRSFYKIQRLRHAPLVYKPA